MTRRIQIERAAEADMAEAVTYIREERPAAALRFVREARKAFQFLAEHPETGRSYETTHPLLQHLRIWRVKGFNRFRFLHTIYFLPPTLPPQRCVLVQGRTAGRDLPVTLIAQTLSPRD